MEGFFNPQFVARLSLVGMAIDGLGGCYLAYDLLGGKRGPLRIIARATGYTALFFIGYSILLGLRYALVAATGMGMLLSIEFWAAGGERVLNIRGRGSAVLFGFLRGLVLGIAGMTIAGPVFGTVFGLLCGAGLNITYVLGFAPMDDYRAEARPRMSRHKILASLLRAVAVSIAGIAAEMIHTPPGHSPLFGLQLGIAAGIVSALVGLLSPVIEWRVENLPERRLGVIGLCLIFAGMILQSVQYWMVVFGAPGR